MLEQLIEDGVSKTGIVGGNIYNVIALNMPTIADSTTYYLGSKAIIPITSALGMKSYILAAGTITKATIEWDAITAGTTEDISIYIRLNNTTDYLIATIGNTNAQKIFSNTALNIPVVVSDFFEIKIVTPAWVTNPVNIFLGGQVYVS